MILLIAVATGACEAPSANNLTTRSSESDALLNDANNALADTSTVAANATTAGEDLSNDRPGWTYSETKDEMRGSIGRSARIDALAAISLGFPYGESTPQLVLRQDPKYGFDIYLTANGQFLCRSYDDDTISVKFDNGPIEQWACADAESGSSDIVFVVRAESFLAKLRKAKRLIVEADMYEAGRQQMKFEVGGLKWGGASTSPAD
ncbi:MAG TPA: hypothetical protein VHM92_12975 [Allosphingosinicella sp.]|nr:hypothetical protein [Allosphingosinicella sp.]